MLFNYKVIQSRHEEKLCDTKAKGGRMGEWKNNTAIDASHSYWESAETVWELALAINLALKSRLSMLTSAEKTVDYRTVELPAMLASQPLPTDLR